MHLGNRHNKKHINDLDHCPEELLLRITTIHKAPCRPGLTYNNSTANIRTTGWDSSSRPPSSLMWFSFLYSNLFGFSGVRSAERQLSVNGRPASLLCWRAERKGHSVSHRLCLTCQLKCRAGWARHAASCWVLGLLLKFSQLLHRRPYVSI